MKIMLLAFIKPLVSLTNFLFQKGMDMILKTHFAANFLKPAGDS